MTTKKTFYITTPVYYPNDIPHLGHAYTTIAADILARWNSLLGKEVFFLTGTDEHGKKLQDTATKAGKKPKEFVDSMIPAFKDAWEKLNIKYDKFIRTTDKEHEKVVQEILTKVNKKGDIYKGFYEGLYCTGCEAYYTEKDAPDKICPIHQRPLEMLKEESYFFKLSKYQKFLLDLYKKNPEFISPESKKNEIISRVKEGLRDFSVSRTSFDWGIPLPFDKSHITFVWFDALLNYYSGTREKGREGFWPADVHLIGKDILWFHTVYWPAMLKSAGIKMPKKVFAHGWWTVLNQKMGKSAGNAIKIDELIGYAGVDSARYFLFRSAPFGDDGDFSQQALIDRHNNELANKLGNLVSRVSTLAETYGLEKTELKRVPKKYLKLEKNNNFLLFGTAIDNESKKNHSNWEIYRKGEKSYPLVTLSEKSDALIVSINNYLESLEFDKALNEIFAFIDQCNEFVQSKKPWETKDKKVLYQLANAIKDFTILLSPFIPETCEKIAKTFNFELSLKALKAPLKINKIKKSEILFKKIDSASQVAPIEHKIIKSPKQTSDNNPKSDNKVNKSSKVEGIMSTNEIPFEDFAKLDLRVAKILSVSDIEGKDRLYKLDISLGTEQRTIVAGIKQFYSRDKLINKKIIIIANLEPAKIGGVESRGMLLAASTPDKSKVILLTPDADIVEGSKIG